MNIKQLTGFFAFVALFLVIPMKPITQSQKVQARKLENDTVPLFAQGSKVVRDATKTNTEKQALLQTLKGQIQLKIQQLNRIDSRIAGRLQKQLNDSYITKGLQSIKAALSTQKPTPPSAPPAPSSPVTRPSAPPLPSAPPAQPLPTLPSRRRTLPPVAPILGFKKKIVGYDPKTVVDYAAVRTVFQDEGRLPISDAREIVSHNLLMSNSPDLSENNVMNIVYEEFVLPYMLEKFNKTQRRSGDTWAGAALDTLMRPLKWVTSDVLRTVMGTMPIPTTGEFDPTALQTFQDWITNLKTQIKDREQARRIIRNATAATEKKVSRFNVFSKKIPPEEQAARILLAARLLEAANDVFARPESSSGFGERREIVQQPDADQSQEPSTDESRQREIVQQPATDQSKILDDQRFSALSPFE